MAVKSAYSNMAVVEARRSTTGSHPGNVQLGRVKVICDMFLFFLDETDEYFGLLIGRHVSVAATGQVDARYGENLKEAVSTDTLVQCLAMSQTIWCFHLPISATTQQANTKSFFFSQIWAFP